MLPRLALVASLLLAGCGYRVDDCNQPEETYIIDEELDEQDVEQLVSDNRVRVASDLECEVVCESIYLDKHPKGGASGVDSCTLTIDGEFTGDPDAVVGAIRCEGLGVPQFCRDA